MSRGLDASTTTALGAAVTQPYYLVSMGFSTPVYLSSRGAISWDTHSWVDASFEIQLDSEPTIRIFNEATTLGVTVLSEGTSGRAIQIYYGDKDDSAHPNPYMLFDGEMGEASINETVSIRCKRLKPLKTPRHYAAPPVCNFIPPPGTRFETPKQVIILE